MSTSASTSPFVEYALRNRSYILDVIKKFIFTTSDAEGMVLSVAEGTGAHSALFADTFENLTFIPSEYDQDQLKTLDKNLNEWKNIKNAIRIDASKPLTWNLEAESFDMITCINMIHIAPWSCCEALMRNAKKHLSENGLLYLYGPYKKNARHTAPSNADFDRWLREQNPQWGVRNMEDVIGEAEQHSFQLRTCVPMPANNFSLLFTC